MTLLSPNTMNYIWLVYKAHPMILNFDFIFVSYKTDSNTIELAIHTRTSFTLMVNGYPEMI